MTPQDALATALKAHREERSHDAGDPEHCDEHCAVRFALPDDAHLLTVESLATALHVTGAVAESDLVDGGVPDVCNRWPEHDRLAAAIIRAAKEAERE